MKFVYTIILFVFFSAAANAQFTKVPVVSSEDVQIKLVKFYPNPATTLIHFEFQKGPETGSSLVIFNFTGKKVYEILNFSQKNTISLSEFFRGVYIFQLKDKTGKIVESGKFQVNK